MTATPEPTRPAVFLDRDGTVIEHVHHLRRWQDVRLVSGAANAIGRLREAGYACVIVTNQSVVGRGMLDLDGLGRIHEEMHRQLAEADTRVDGLYYCTLAPSATTQDIVEHPDRKPGPGMLLRGARDLGLDVSRSWMVGDSLSDLLAGKNAGCLGSILVLTGYGKKTSRETGWQPCVPDIAAAADWVLSESRSSS